MAERIEDEFARRVFRVAAPVDAAAMAVYFVLFAWRGQWGPLALVVAQVVVLALAWGAGRRGRHRLGLQLILWPAWMANLLQSIGEGGYGGGSAWWLIVPPAVLIQAGGLRSGAAMIAMSFLELLGCHLLQRAGWMAAPPPASFADPQVSLAVLGSSACVATTVWMGMRWRRELLRELDAMREGAEEATRVKSRFIANISHEIRTPLNGIVGAAELLRLSRLDAGQAQAAQIIDHSAQSLLAVVNDVLDFSKLEARRVELERIALDPRALAYDTAETFAGQAQARHLALWAHVMADVPAQIHSDPVRLRQILHNLVSNALKFTEAGEIRIEVAVRRDADAAAPRLRFAVRDTGIGLDAAQQARLFRAFTQADLSTTRRFGGTGLGLVICRELAELLGGRLELVSAPGAGSTFALLLPLAADDIAGPNEAAAPTGRTLQLCVARPALRDDLVDAACRSGDVVVAPVAGTPDQWIEAARVAGADVAVVDDEALRATGVPRDDWAARLHGAGLHGVLMLDVAVPVAAVPAGVVPLYKPVRPLRLASAVREARRPAPAPATAPAALPVAADAKRPGPAIARPRVLLVEDNTVNQAVATALLARIGVDCDVADDGEMALERLSDGAAGYAAVLMDCQMPVLDGYAATRAWREQEALADRPRIPVIAMTANSLAEAGEACTAAGMDDFVTKPFTLRDLRDVLERWLPGRLA